MKVLASFLIGLLLAPLAGVFGFSWHALLVGGIPTFHSFNPRAIIEFLLIGGIAGLLLFSFVTAIALPTVRLVLQLSEVDDQIWLPAVGFFMGLFPMMIIESHPLYVLGGGIAGCFCGYVLSNVMRRIDPIPRGTSAANQTAGAVS